MYVEEQTNPFLLTKKKTNFDIHSNYQSCRHFKLSWMHAIMIWCILFNSKINHLLTLHFFFFVMKDRDARNDHLPSNALDWRHMTLFIIDFTLCIGQFIRLILLWHFLHLIFVCMWMFNNIDLQCLLMIKTDCSLISGKRKEWCVCARSV